MKSARGNWRLLACAACIGMSSHAAEPILKSADAPYTVVTFGDSTTAPRTVEGGDLDVYADLLQEELMQAGVNAQVINAGVGSDTTVRARKRFESDVLIHEPDLVIIQFGLNDSCIDVRLGEDAPRVALRDYVDNLSYFAKTLSARGSRVILMTPNPLLWTEKLKALYGSPPYDTDDRWGFNLLNAHYAATVRAVAQSMNVPLVDVYQYYAHYDRVPKQAMGDLLLDGMHPNARGHAIIADALMEEITRMGFAGLERKNSSARHD